MKNDLELTFVFEGKKYVILEKDSQAVFINDEGNEDWFWWLEGNGGCDCNRSIVIHRQFPDFPEMNCGNGIELIDYKII